MKKAKYTQNRELSWLKFNERVLEEASASDVPLLERLKYIAIFTTNLDEFFMIRVGSHIDMANEPSGGQNKKKSNADNKTGMTPGQILEKIYKAVPALYKKRDEIYENLDKELRGAGIWGLEYKELNAEERQYADAYYKKNIQPRLSPQIIDGKVPFPHLQNKALYAAALFKAERTAIGLVQVPKDVPAVIFFPDGKARHIRTELIIRKHMASIFPKRQIAERNIICVTRSGDLSEEEIGFDEDDDFRLIMKNALKKRPLLAPVRLEAAYILSGRLQKYLKEKLDITDGQIYRAKAPINISYLTELDKRLRLAAPELFFRKFNQKDLKLNKNQDIYKLIEK
ncbi:MAG: RNA degradosome polyphosphate kinase, partial [Oscillospiraceae bacterium]|nr:RNA degradosome polyphosphate kinase [Oscillospiraceae bacterium]